MTSDSHPEPEIPVDLTIDSSILVKALVPPRRRKKDVTYKRQLALHQKALEIFECIIRKERMMFIPSVVLVEVAAVISRITNNKENAIDAVEKIRKHSHRILSDSEILEESITIATETKASGFDNIILACAELTESALITDDSRLHEIAKGRGIKSYLLKELIDPEITPYGLAEDKEYSYEDID